MCIDLYNYAYICGENKEIKDFPLEQWNVSTTIFIDFLFINIRAKVIVYVLF